MPRCHHFLTLAATIACFLFFGPTIAWAQQATESASLPVDESSSKASGLFATGVVFEDRDGDGRLSDVDSLFSGVRVSNGVEIVKTDNRGRYRLPLKEGQLIFVIKPNGFRTSLNRLNLPQFYYIYKPNGSPKLRFAGSEPTGDLPRSIDFPLYRQSEPEQFQCILFGDPQPRNKQEVDYMEQDVVSELIGSPSAFGVTLGDITFDDLSLFPRINETISRIGIPWYNVIGNHDINFDARSRKFANETFEATYGPSYYSYDYGQVHFIVLDNIDWLPATPGQRGRYVGRLGKKQLEWVKQDLGMIPESQMVVLFMHIPIVGMEDCQELYRMIEKRPYCISFSAHMHQHQHIFLGKEQGWQGDKPHHHVVNVTVSGSWWGGVKSEKGIPHATMSDGAPNGYTFLSFDRNGYRLDFKAAGSDDQMGIRLPFSIASEKVAGTEVAVNVYNGSSKSTVEMRVDGNTDWIKMERREAIDPGYQEMHQREARFSPPVNPALPKPRPSAHVWFGSLPAGIAPGMHVLNVRTTDMSERIFEARRLFRVETPE